MIEGDALGIIEEAIKEGSSDIHIMPTKKSYEVYFRNQGRLVFNRRMSHPEGKKLISYFKFIANMDVGEKRKPQSGAAEFTLYDGIVELRFSTINSVLMLESIVIRILKQNKLKNQSVLTYFPRDLATLRKLVRRKSGLILFSGPVGSGKTTTIYQLLRERLDEEVLQIITMEDPVEMIEEKFLQVEVNERGGIGYNTIIRSSLRHHPDILMIGEIRDEDTARMAIRGALTGHLMIATIHAKNALGVIGRLQELQITDEQLKQTLIGVISQRLVPGICPYCKGTCHKYCYTLSHHIKRAAIFEIIEGEMLKDYFTPATTRMNFPTINHKLKKAWVLGYINEEDYYKFEIV